MLAGPLLQPVNSELEIRIAAIATNTDRRIIFIGLDACYGAEHGQQANRTAE